MSFCPICKRVHDSDLLCGDGLSQILREAGLKQESEPLSKSEFQKTAVRARKAMFIVFVVLVSICAVAAFVAMHLRGQGARESGVSASGRR